MFFLLYNFIHLYKNEFENKHTHTPLFVLTKTLHKYFTKHVEKKYGSQWNKLQPDEKTRIVKQEMTKNRIPRKGGKKTKKRKATARRRANTRKNRKTNRAFKNRH